MIGQPKMQPEKASRGCSIEQRQQRVSSLVETMSKGSFTGITQQLLRDQRDSQAGDWQAPLRDALHYRQVSVGSRKYDTCLIGIPLFGDLGSPLQPVAVVDMLKDIQKRFLKPDQGLVFLNTPLPRSFIHQMTIEDLFNLTPALFNHVVKGGTGELLRKEFEFQTNHVESAILVGVLYWKAGKQIPALMSDNVARQALGTCVAQRIVFDRATSATRVPFIEALPVDLFLNATRGCAQHLTRRLLGRLSHDESLVAPVFSINVIPVSDSGSEFYAVLECRDDSDQHAAPLVGGINMGELCDGNLADFLSMLRAECARAGRVEDRITYMPFSCPETDDQGEAFEVLIHE